MPALFNAAAPWQDLNHLLPEMCARVLCYSVQTGRLFVARRVIVGETWQWQYGDKEFCAINSVDHWAPITLPKQ